MSKALAGILGGFFAGVWFSIMVMYATWVLFAEQDDYFMPDDLLWLLLSPAVLFLGGVMGAAIGAVLAERGEVGREEAAMMGGRTAKVIVGVVLIYVRISVIGLGFF